MTDKQAQERTGDRKLSERSFPSRFGRYLLMDRLAAGGMAEVFRARADSDGNRLIAIKCMLPALADDEEFAGMFVDEAKLAAQLQHPNIAQIYELGRHGEQLYIAMELIHGRDLRAIVRKAKRSGKKLSHQFVAYVIAKAAEALDYAHSKKSVDGRPLKLVHRDVSPQNILVGYDGEVKVVDFGIAKAELRRTVSRVGILKGKFAYMAPEQVKTGEVDGRTDIFALGAVLYETLAGRKLFYGESDFSILERVTNGTVPDDPSAWEKLPADIANVVRRAVTVEAEKRFQEASHMAAALEPLLIGERSFYGQKQARDVMHELFGPEIAENEQILRSFAIIRSDDAPRLERRPSQRTDVIEARDWSLVTREPIEEAAEDKREGTKVERIEAENSDVVKDPDRSGTAQHERERAGTVLEVRPERPDDTRHGADEETRIMEIGTAPGPAESGRAATRSRIWGEAKQHPDTRPVASIPNAIPVAPKPYLLWGISTAIMVVLAALVGVGLVQRAREIKAARQEAEQVAEAKGQRLAEDVRTLASETPPHVDETQDVVPPPPEPHEPPALPNIETTPLKETTTDSAAVAHTASIKDPIKEVAEVSADIVAEPSRSETAKAEAGRPEVSKPAVATPRVGYISVRTVDGRAARVFVDKKDIGPTPLIGRSVPIGAHVIRIVDKTKADRVKSVQVTVTSSHSKKTPLDLTVGL